MSDGVYDRIEDFSNVQRNLLGVGVAHVSVTVLGLLWLESTFILVHTH